MKIEYKKYQSYFIIQMKKKALIFGVTGQDGSYLSELLLKKITLFME